MSKLDHHQLSLVFGSILWSLGPVMACSSSPAPSDPVDEDAGTDELSSIVPDASVRPSRVDAGRDGSTKDASRRDGAKDAEPTLKDAGFAVEGSPCNTTSIQQSPCGKCGTTSRACLDDGARKTKVWGPWGACLGELTDSDACDPSLVYPDETCGNCGVLSRTCELDCHFDVGGGCVEPTFNGEAACSPSSREFLLGASCSGANEGRYRTCDNQCQWSSAGACVPFVVTSTGARMSMGNYGGCAITGSGSLKCWGHGDHGQLGNGSTADAAVPVVVPGVTNVQGVAHGSSHACTVDGGGGVKCWGSNGVGQLGQGNTTDALSPVATTGLAGVQVIGAGGSHTCAVLAGGAVKCWGFNAYGALGNGNTTNATTPVQVQGLTGATSVAGGYFHTCALLAGGTVKCWGDNDHGQLGDGSTTSSSIPVAVSNLTNVLAVVTGGDHSCALVSGGVVKCWGDNTFGQCGSPMTSHTLTTPVAVSGITGALAIGGGGAHSCAIVAGGLVKCWGSNSVGQLGNGQSFNVASPVQATGISGASEIALGADLSCARIAASGIRCWGNGIFGALGNGAGAISRVPVPVTGF